MQILLADDNRDFCDTTAAVLETEGHDVVCAYSEANAVSLLRDGGHKFDIAVLDMYMEQDDSGLRLIKVIADENPSVVPIILTGRQKVRDAVASMKAGAFDYVEKGGTEQVDLLTIAIKKATRFRRARAAAKRAARMRHKYHQAQEREIKAAEAIQKVLFCPTPPILHHVKLDVAYKPANLVMGDYYDFVTRESPERLIVAVGDAAGHGLPAALNAHVACGAWRAVTERPTATTSPGDILGVINRIVCRTGMDAPQMTLFVGQLDLQTFELTYSSAGHPPPLLFKEGTCIRLDSGDLMLGVDETWNYRNFRKTLERGDILLFYSDGVTELERTVPSAASGVPNHGIDGLCKEAEELLAVGGKALLATRLLERLRGLLGDNAFIDDCTLVSLEITA